MWPSLSLTNKSISLGVVPNRADHHHVESRPPPYIHLVATDNRHNSTETMRTEELYAKWKEITKKNALYKRSHARKKEICIKGLHEKKNRFRVFSLYHCLNANMGYMSLVEYGLVSRASHWKQPLFRIFRHGPDTANHMVYFIYIGIRLLGF